MAHPPCGPAVWFVKIYYGKNIFMHVFAASAASPASPTPTHPSIKDSTKGGRRPKAGGPPLWRRPKAASFMDGCVGVWGAGEAADAAKTNINICFPVIHLHKQYKSLHFRQQPFFLSGYNVFHSG